MNTEDRILELIDLYEATTLLNEVGFNLSSEDLLREAQEYGVNLAETEQGRG